MPIKKVLVIIPARGGSKGIPGKNIKLLCGKPLIAYVITSALQSTLISRLIVTTDDIKIARVAKRYGAEVPFMRPAHLAQDATPMPPVIQHALNYLEKNEGYRPNIVVVLQPTSPLVRPSDIDNSIKKMLKDNADSCVGVCEASEMPELMYRIGGGGKIYPIIKPALKKGWRRQDIQRTFFLNGALYVSKRDNITKEHIRNKNNTVAWVMPAERSVDIDDAADFKLAEKLIKKLKG